MDGQPPPAVALAPQRLQPRRRFKIADGFLDIEAEGVFHLLGRRGADPDQPAAIAERAGNAGLVVGGDGDIADALGADRRHQQRDAIAIGVGLHHRAQPRIADRGADGIDIGLERFGIDFDPAVAPRRPGRRQAMIVRHQHWRRGRAHGAGRNDGTGGAQKIPAMHQSCPRFRNRPG